MKTVRRIAIELLANFGATQIIMLFINTTIFANPYSWISGTTFGMVVGMTITYQQRAIAQYIKNNIQWIKHPIKSIIFSFVLGTLSTTITIFIYNYLYLVWFYEMSLNDFIQPNLSAIKLALIIYIVASIVSHAVVFYIKWRNLAIEAERQKHETLRLQFEALKNHVNPHFLFNSLTSLAQLIATDQQKAIEFTSCLSNIYRLILDMKDRNIVPLRQEMKLVDAYIGMQRIKFGHQVLVSVNIDTHDNRGVIPLSVQMVVENVFKHNTVSRSKPLNITISADDECLSVTNNLIPRRNTDEHVPSGLANIRSRYEYLTGKTCTFQETDTHYIVKLPLIEALD